MNGTMMIMPYVCTLESIIKMVEMKCEKGRDKTTAFRETLEELREHTVEIDGYVQERPGRPYEKIWVTTLDVSVKSLRLRDDAMIDVEVLVKVSEEMDLAEMTQGALGEKDRRLIVCYDYVNGIGMVTHAWRYLSAAALKMKKDLFDEPGEVLPDIIQSSALVNWFEETEKEG